MKITHVDRVGEVSHERTITFAAGRFTASLFFAIGVVVGALWSPHVGTLGAIAMAIGIVLVSIAFAIFDIYRSATQ